MSGRPPMGKTLSLLLPSVHLRSAPSGPIAPTDRADDDQLVLPLQKVACHAQKSCVVVHEQNTGLEAVFQVCPIRHGASFWLSLPTPIMPQTRPPVYGENPYLWTQKDPISGAGSESHWRSETRFLLAKALGMLRNAQKAATSSVPTTKTWFLSTRRGKSGLV